jgi:hypothetical protein
MSIFSDGAPIEIIVKYVETKNGGAVIVTDDKDVAKYGDKIKLLKTHWGKESWKATNTMIRGSMGFNAATGQPMVDAASFRDTRLKTLLKAWDAKDDAGVPVPCTPDNIDLLQNDIATALLNAYDAKTLVSKEELGN